MQDPAEYEIEIHRVYDSTTAAGAHKLKKYIYYQQLTWMSRQSSVAL